jgi:hypothetical protein
MWCHCHCVAAKLMLFPQAKEIARKAKVHIIQKSSEIFFYGYHAMKPCTAYAFSSSLECIVTALLELDSPLMACALMVHSGNNPLSAQMSCRVDSQETR